MVFISGSWPATATNMDSLQHIGMKYIEVYTEPQPATLSVLLSFPC